MIYVYTQAVCNRRDAFELKAKLNLTTQCSALIIFTLQGDQFQFGLGLYFLHIHIYILQSWPFRAWLFTGLGSCGLFFLVSNKLKQT